MRKIVIGGVILGVALGVGWTAGKDYLPWRRAETDQYGHGPGELGAAGVANKLFSEGGAAVRINYPGSWEVHDVWGSKTWPVKTDVAVFSPAGSDVKVTLEMFNRQGSLTDIVDETVKEKGNLGWEQWGERQYISTDRADITVVTWQVTGADKVVRMRQEALAKKGERLAVAEADCSLTDWRTYSGTFWEMFTSLVVI